MRRRRRRATAALAGLVLITSLIAGAGDGAAVTGSEEVRIPLDDQVSLAGTVFGKGATAVVLSHMSDSTQTSWRPLAVRLAARGYLVLTYDFLSYGRSQTRFASSIDLERDLRAAIKFVRARGARSIVLGGASAGGVATLKVAVAERPRALVVLASAWACCGITIERRDLRRLASPKLFVTAGHDVAGVTSALRGMFKAAAPPKQLHVYPSATAHGTHLFETRVRGDLLRRIESFLIRYSPPG